MRLKRSVGSCFLLLALLAGSALAAGVQYVQIQKAELRSTPSMLGGVVASVRLGEPVNVVEDRSPWLKVASPAGATGWIHQSALSRQAVTLRAGGAAAPAAVSSQEMGQATKGFNAQVEAAYKIENRQVDFAPVDRMIGVKITAEEMRGFLSAGGLQPGAGPRPVSGGAR